jgi:glycosyltransferase involved in cell wall biosynthesis
MRIILATTQVPFVRGGAEILTEGLRDALCRSGHEAEIVAIPFKWYPPERVLDAMLACRLLDLTESCGTGIDVMIGLKFPAYYIAHPRKVLWLLHQYRAAYDLWGHKFADLHLHPNGSQVRAAIEEADRRLLPEARAICSLSRNVSDRLQRYCGLGSTPLYHPPLNAERFYCAGAAEDYLFFPSRLNRAKRQELVLEALAETRLPVEVRFAGVADEGAYEGQLRELARSLGVAERVQWLGNISEEEKIGLYARSVGVLYAPLDEDYGYVTLEAMLSAKAVITCTDSGGPLEFVVSGETGFVAEPSAAGLAEAMDRLWENRACAQRLGQAARDRYASLDISWTKAIEQLLTPVA